MCLTRRKVAGTALMILMFLKQRNRKSDPVEREVDTFSSTSTSKETVYFLEYIFPKQRNFKMSFHPLKSGTVEIQYPEHH
jgi:hypothetical protein